MHETEIFRSRRSDQLHAVFARGLTLHVIGPLIAGLILGHSLE